MKVQPRIPARVWFATCVLTMLCSCTTTIDPAFPADWPSIEGKGNYTDIAGVYANQSSRFTPDNTADKTYVPTLARALHADCEEAFSVRVSFPESGLLKFTFLDHNGNEIKKRQFRASIDYIVKNASVEITESASHTKGGDTGFGKSTTITKLYRSTSGDLIVRQQFKFVGLDYFFPVRYDESQWTMFQPIPSGK